MPALFPAELATRKFPAPVRSLIATKYRWDARASVGDPSGIENATPVVIGNQSEGLRFAIDTPGVATLPNATNIGGPYVEWVITDLFGATARVDSLDIAMFLLWWNGLDNLPVDTYVAIAFTAGGVATIDNAGVVVGLQYNALGPRAFFMVNAGSGAGWAGKTDATSQDNLARGVASWIGQGGGLTSLFKSCTVLDAGGVRSSITNSSPGAVAGNQLTDGPFTHVAIVVGWSGAGGAGTQTFDLSLRSFVAPPSKFADWDPRLTPTAPPAVPDPPRRFAIVGDSNANGTTVDATHGGLAVPAGWTFRDAGVNLANWPATGTPSVGMAPYLLENAVARGATSGTRWIARRGSNGADTGWPGTIHDQLANLIADCVTLTGDPEILVVVFGANDANNTTESARYFENLLRALRVWRHRFPNCAIALIHERTTDPGTYPELESTIYAALAQLAGEFERSFRVFSKIPSDVAMADAIHFSQSAAGGQDVMADRTFTALYG
ncbi:MAG: hypothetical protein L0206_20325 [Actinobacteria bacterium]|nr:hypothetical protein [Actinomycetota bacterium]